jgi:hypothetical protein
MSSELPPNERPREPRSGGGNFPLYGLAAALIVIGGWLLLRNLGLVPAINFPGNWWALFFLIPIFAIGGDLVCSFRQEQGYTPDMNGKIFGIGLFTIMMVIFLFGLDWGRFWPAFIILFGVMVLGNALARRAS